MDDAEALARHANNPNVSRWLRDRFPFPYTIEDAHKFLTAVTGQLTDGPEFVLAIEVDGEACGGIGLVRGTDIERNTAELGYWLGEFYWRRNIVTTAIRNFVLWAMDRFALTRVHADVFVENPASGRVLEKAGFRLESVKRRAAVKRGEIYDLQYYVFTR